MFKICLNKDCKCPEKEICEQNFRIGRNKNGSTYFAASCLDCEREYDKMYMREYRNSGVRKKGKKDPNLKQNNNCVLKICANKNCNNPEKECNKDNYELRYYRDDGSPYFNRRCRNCENERKLQYNKNHRDQINTQIRNKSKNDLTFRLRKLVSKEVYRALKKNGGSKNNHSIINYLDYTIETLHNHLMTLFAHPDNITADGEIWMTMENHGPYSPQTWDDNDPKTWTWHIDHIIPHSELPYDTMDHPNFKKAWALSNIRPFSAKQNIIDGATRVRHKKT